MHCSPSSLGSDLWYQARYGCLFPWLRVQGDLLRMALAHPSLLPSSRKAAIGPHWVGEGLVSIGQNDTHVGQVLKAPAQDLP